MSMPDARLAALSSPDLLVALERTAAQGREVTADLVALLAECDARQLYATEGYPSLFEFCVARLRLSEAQAYHRIQAARAARRFPLVLERLRDGRVSLTAVALLREHLTEANHREVLDWADGRRKREVEMFVRRLEPQPEGAPSLRRLTPPRPPTPVALAAERPTSVPAVIENVSSQAVPPAPFVQGLSSPALPSAAPALPLLPRPPFPAPRPAPAEIHPTAPARFSLRVIISEETADKLRRAQALLAHALPSADAAVVLDRALTLLLAQLERRKAGAPPKRRPSPSEAPPKPAEAALSNSASAPSVTVTPPPPARETRTRAGGTGAPLALSLAAAAPTRPPARSRYIPAPVRRAVWDRDGGRCAYVSSSGTRCPATAALEFHHAVPFAEGGASTIDNLSLACSRHNAVEAERWFNFDRTEFGVRESRSPMPGLEAGPTTSPCP